MDQHAALLRDIEDFLAETGMARSTFGRLAMNDGKFMDRMAAGGGITLRNVDRVREFIAARRAAAPAPGAAKVA